MAVKLELEKEELVEINRALQEMEIEFLKGFSAYKEQNKDLKPGGLGYDFYKLALINLNGKSASLARLRRYIIKAATGTPNNHMAKRD